MATRAIRVLSSSEIEDAEIGLLDDFKAGNGHNVVNGVANGTSSAPLISPASSLRRGGYASK